MFETVLNVESSQEEIMLESSETDMGFNYLAGNPLSFVNQKAMQGTPGSPSKRRRSQPHY